jgi:iron(III) transport system substrate-binding protein
MMILNWSQQQDDAKKFIDYVLSDAGQAEVAKVYLMPARTDVPADRPLIGDLKLLTVDEATVDPKRDEILAEFAKIFAQ